MITSLRVVRSGRRSERIIRSAEDAYGILRPMARGLDREHFWRLDLDSRRRLIGCELISIGSLDASIVHPREVFKGAFLNNAHSIMVAHNHPSHDLRPSQADRRTTKQLLFVSLMLQVDLVDHLIVGDERYFSFKKAGLL